MVGFGSDINNLLQNELEQMGVFDIGEEEEINLAILFQDPDEPLIQFPDSVPEDSQYRGFHVENTMHMFQVTLLLDTYDTFYNDYWAINIQQRGLVRQVEIYRREHEGLELAQLRQELDCSINHLIGD